MVTTTCFLLALEVLVRRLVLWLSVGAFVVVAALVAATIVYVFPASDEVEHANAVIVLGPATPDRVALGQQLVDEGRVDRMIISAGRPGWAYDKASIPECRDRTADCFMPVPATTAGEALKIAEIAERDSWTSVAVVTATPHVARARTIFESCSGIAVDVVAPPAVLEPAGWLYEFAYQTGGYAKFAIVGCAQPDAA